MSDPRLNSVHLPGTRKDDFRAARDALLNSRGEKTLQLEGHTASRKAKDPPTALIPQGRELPKHVRHVLVDGDFIHPLKVGINTVGRMPDNDVVVADPYVSRRHIAILVHAQNGCEVHDIASRNGTLLNGKLISRPTKLKSGDCLLLSDHQLTFLTQEGVGSQEENDRTQAD